MKKIKTVINQNGEKLIKVSPATVGYALAILLIVLVGLGSILAYGTNTEIGQKIAAKIAVVIPFPAAIVNNRQVIFLKDLENNVAAVQKFYQTQDFASEGLRVDFTTQTGKKRLEIKKREVLDKMVEDQIIQALAKQNGITISAADVDKAVSAKLNEYGTADDVKADLARSYGWNMEDFKQQVVLPSMYQQALEKIILSKDPGDATAKEKINQAQKELQDGKDFAQVVQKYSEGPSKDQQGELGWVKKEQVLPELQTALFGAQTPNKNSILESSIGFHIIDIENKKKENGTDVLELRQVFVAKNTFADWLEKQKKLISVAIPMKEFMWNKVTGTVDFRDQTMKLFEAEQRTKAQGDASIMF